LPQPPPPSAQDLLLATADQPLGSHTHHVTCADLYLSPSSPPTTPQDLLLAAADQPFRFPATFTFVVRSFTVLDGIGKSLDPRFDISEISAPYARNLLLEGQPQVGVEAGTDAT
jgi:hypothetical protein